MKNLMIGLLVVSAVLTACGKKGGGGGGGGSAGVGVGAAGACSLNQFGSCVGGVALSGVVPANKWTGNLSVTEYNKYRQFMVDNGLCYSMQCQSVSGFLTLWVQTLADSNNMPGGTPYASLPNWINFGIIPRSNGYYAPRNLQTRGDGFVNAANNGFQITYNRNVGYPGQGFPGQGYPGYPGQGGYPGYPGQSYPGYPGVNPQIAAVNNTLQIVVTWADATQTIANASIVYQGVQIANGTIRAQFYGGSNVLNNVNNGYPVNGQQLGQGPAVLPARPQ